MSQPCRFDAYGAPIAPLTDARQESLAERPVNQRQRQVLRMLLEETLLLLLHRGSHAEVTLHCAIKDGMLVADMSVGVTRHYRSVKEED